MGKYYMEKIQELRKENRRGEQSKRKYSNHVWGRARKTVRKETSQRCFDRDKGDGDKIGVGQEEIEKNEGKIVHLEGKREEGMRRLQEKQQDNELNAVFEGKGIYRS